MAAYEFPKLKISEIVGYMKQLDCPLAPEDITDPKADVMLHVYAYFVEFFMGVSREEVQQAQFGALDVLEHRELYDDAIGEIGMHRMLRRLMHTIGLHDYSMRDHIKPDKARVVKILSGLINFAKFRQEHLDLFEDMCETSESLVEKKAQLETQNQQLSDELQRIRDARLQEQPVVQQLHEETNELAEAINSKNSEQAQLRQMIDDLKVKASEVKEKVTNTKLLLLNAKQDIGKLQSQVVHSPQKVKSTIAALNQQVEQEKENVLEANRKARMLQEKTSSLTRIEKDLEKCLQLLQDGCAEQAKLETLTKNMRDMESRIADNEVNARELTDQEKHLQRLIHAKDEQLAQLRAKRATKLQTLQKTVSDLQDERSKAMLGRNAEQVKVQELRGKVTQIQQGTQQEKVDHQKELDAVMSRCEDLEAQVAQYSVRLDAAMARMEALN